MNLVASNFAVYIYIFVSKFMKIKAMSTVSLLEMASEARAYSLFTYPLNQSTKLNRNKEQDDSRSLQEGMLNYSPSITFYA